MTNILYGGEENVKRRTFILNTVESLGISKYEMDRSQLVEKAIENFIRVHTLYPNFRPLPADIGYMTENSTLTGPLMPCFLLFVPTLLGQASDEQVQIWLPKTLTFQMVGAYCQTELSHGSNVRGLQTVAVYDKLSDSFVINSPTLGATKWWNSGAGCVATHGAVFAKLVIDGKSYGNHCFLVQFRDENFLPLPGIEIGDTGPKMGDDAIDTGFIRFTHVRVPREHLMAKRQYVTADGKYVKKQSGNVKGAEFASYRTMVMARAGTLGFCAGKLAIAATIAARYSCVRHQGFESSKKGENEIAIIDYQIQKYRVLKQIANSYAFRFTAGYMTAKMASLNERDAAGEGVDDLAEIHAASSGLKSVGTRLAADGIEDLRRCCGGHGYLLNSGIAKLVTDFVWTGTAEGDFFVLILQSARFLLKSYQVAKKGEPLSGLMKVLEPLGNKNFRVSQLFDTQRISSKNQVSIEYIDKLLGDRVLVLVASVGEKFENLVNVKKLPFEEAFNNCALELEQAATAQIIHFIYHQFFKMIISSQESKKPENASCIHTLKQLCLLFGLGEILRGNANWNGIIERSSVPFLEEMLFDVLNDLRPNVVSLVDAFDIPDAVLNSTLGRYDGDVYQALFDAAKSSKLNKTVPFSGYERVLKPHLDLEFLKLRGDSDPFLKEVFAKL